MELIQGVQHPGKFSLIPYSTHQGRHHALILIAARGNGHAAHTVGPAIVQMALDCNAIRCRLVKLHFVSDGCKSPRLENGSHPFLSKEMVNSTPTLYSHFFCVENFTVFILTTMLSFIRELHVYVNSYA
jgi:hypothetical protein